MSSKVLPLTKKNLANCLGPDCSTTVNASAITGASRMQLALKSNSKTLGRARVALLEPLDLVNP